MIDILKLSKIKSKPAQPRNKVGFQRTLNSYNPVGIALVIIGFCFTPFSYIIIGSVPLTAIGLSTIILGFTSIGLASVRPNISLEGSRILLRTGIENTDTLLKELKLENKAIYLPSKMRDGHPQALIPLFGEGKPINSKGKLPGCLVVICGPNSEEKAIAVTTPGNLSLDMLPNKPGPTADEIESAIIYILIGMDIASGVRVNLIDSRVKIEVTGVKKVYEGKRYYQCLGSPIASIAAAISSEALDKPVRIFEENHYKGTSKIVLEVLS